MDGSETKGVEEAVGSAREAFQSGNHTAYIDGRFLGEGARGVEMVEEDDGPCHGSQTEHIRLLVGESLLDYHILAYIGHRRQSHGHIISGNGGILREKFDRRFIDDVHHWSGICEEEGHFVGELVPDGDIDVRLGNFLSVEGPSVIREVVLNGGIHHLQIIEPQDEIEDVSHLLRERLLRSYGFFRINFA